MADRTKLGQAVISKYEGLRRIELYRLPHPAWRFVTVHEDVSPVPWADAPHGWTIRTCPRDKYEFGLPSKHRLDYEHLPNALRTLHQETGIWQFVIYPSWEFELSGCFMLTSDYVYVEVVTGDIAPLLRGQRTPDATYYCQGPYYSRLTLIAGEQEMLSSYEKSLFSWACRRIFTKGFAVLEWTRTTEGKVLFHDLLEFRTKN